MTCLIGSAMPDGGTICYGMTCHGVIYDDDMLCYVDNMICYHIVYYDMQCYVML